MEDMQSCVKLSVEPSRGLMDEKFVVLVEKAPSGSQLTVHALHQCEDGHKWQAFAHYTADAAGTVNVSEDPSLGGTYLGVEPMGLLWSLKPVPSSKPGLRMRKKNVEVPMLVTISVYEGHQSESFGSVILASVEVERCFMGPGVQRIPVTVDGLTATLFLPSGPGPFSGLLQLGGLGGQLMEYRAALLASHGFASMALDYLSRTTEEMKVMDEQYFEKAFRFLQQHPKVVSSRISMLGLSLGASIVLKMAAYSHVGKVKCCVCISGSHVQPIDGSVTEILSFFRKNSGKFRFSEEKAVIWRDLLLPIPLDPSLKVDVGRIQCPLLLIVGQDDMNCGAPESAMDMKAMMERAGNSHLLKLLSYPGTGHMIEAPYLPHTRVSVFRALQSSKKMMALWGGQTQEHSHAQEDSWRKLLSFLGENL